MHLGYCETIIVALILGYFIGGIPWGYLIGRLKGIDIRNSGSGNIGATNVFRVLGKKWGGVVFALDCLKGGLPCFAAQHFFVLPVGFITKDGFGVVVAAATIFGHMFTPYLKFKGGKGVATTAGTLIALMPFVFLTCLFFWLLVFFVSRYVSLASLTSAVVLPLATFFIYKNHFWLFGVACAVSVLIFLRHKSNIRRLIEGTESRIGVKQT
jgi:glycerol-3-phosphate acyltransferase PlsY